jgi:hypothetical protein
MLTFHLATWEKQLFPPSKSRPKSSKLQATAAIAPSNTLPKDAPIIITNFPAQSPKTSATSRKVDTINTKLSVSEETRIENIVKTETNP